MLVTLSYHSCSKKPRTGRDFARLSSSLAPLRVAQTMHGLNSNSGFPTRARGEQANTSSSKGGCQEEGERGVREEKRGETARAQRAGQDNQDEGGLREREREEEGTLRVTTVAVTRSGDNKGARATTARGRKTDEGRRREKRRRDGDERATGREGRCEGGAGRRGAGGEAGEGEGKEEVHGGPSRCRRRRGGAND